DRELTTATQAITVHFHRPAVHLHQRLHHCKADTETISRSLHRGVHLREHLEETWKLLGGDAYAVISYANDYLIAFSLDRQPNTTALVGKLKRIVQKVADHLGESCRVGIQIDRVGRQSHRQLTMSALVERTKRFNSLIDDWRELGLLFAELELASRDATHVEQVVDQAHHLAHLTLEHF